MRFNLCLKLLLGEAFISRAQTLSDQDMQVVINDLAIGAQQPYMGAWNACPSAVGILGTSLLRGISQLSQFTPTYYYPV